MARLATIAVILSVAATTLPVLVAHAAYPGVNGKLALETCGLKPCETRGIWMTNANGVGLERLVARGASPAWSPNGRRVAFTDDRSGSGDIYAVRASGDDQERLTSSGANDLDPTWSSDGTRIAFTRRVSGQSSLFVMNADGTDLQEIANTEGAEDPAWSPIDDVVAFADEGVLSVDIKVVDVSTETVTDVTAGEADDAEPAWAPDGQLLAFEREVSDSNVEIFTTAPNGTGLDRITESDGLDTSPAWSPDGTQIAWLSNRSDNPGVFRSTAAGTGTERVKSVRAKSLDWQACEALADCAGGRVERRSTALTLRHEKTNAKVIASGALKPTLPGQKVEVTLLRRKDGSFRKVSSKKDDLDSAGRYGVRFDRPRKGTCKLLARFPGDDDYAPDKVARKFKCAIPLHLVAYSPEQLPSNTERALERINGVKATTMWSGSKFLKSSRADGRRVDNPPSGHTIPLDVAFVQPKEFAEFAQPGDRAAIRSLNGNEALMAKDEVGLRKGHARLRMRFTVGRARSKGAISNASAQGYELILPMPAPRASVAFRTVLIEKPPGVSRKRIARKLRDVVGSKPLELRSEKEVPYLRAGMLVRPQLFIKKAFGEFSMRPTTGRNIHIGGSWVRNNIKSDGVPILGNVTCHRKIFPQLRRAMEELRKRGLAHTVTRSNYAGCFNPRFISSYTVGPVKRISRHAYGIALDINAGTNPFGSRPRQDRRFVRIMKKWGFTWGGRWALPDGMHFEWERFP
jgi:Tol biopolymer transport system component